MELADRPQAPVEGGRAPVAAPLGYAPYNSYPHLRLGSKGDFVAWAQQLLAGAGYSTPISGYYRSVTQSAVLLPGRSRPAAERQPRCAHLGPAPEGEPAAGSLDQGGAVAASKDDGHLVLPPPKSATLPAVRDEIP